MRIYESSKIINNDRIPHPSISLQPVSIMSQYILPPYNAIAIPANSVPCKIGPSLFNQVSLDPTFRVLYDRTCRIISCTDCLAYRFNPTGQVPLIFQNLLQFIRPEDQQHLLTVPYDPALNTTSTIRKQGTSIMTEVARSERMHVRYLDLVDHEYGYLGYVAYITTIRVSRADGSEQIIYDCVFRPRHFSG